MVFDLDTYDKFKLYSVVDSQVTANVNVGQDFVNFRCVGA